MDLSSHEDSAVEFCSAAYIFNEAVRIYEQGNKALLTELVG